MPWVIILVLTFSNGAYVQTKDIKAESEAACIQTIVIWKNWMHKLFDHQPAGMPKASTFITGCSQEGQK